LFEKYNKTNSKSIEITERVICDIQNLTIGHPGMIGRIGYFINSSSSYYYISFEWLARK